MNNVNRSTQITRFPYQLARRVRMLIIVACSLALVSVALPGASSAQSLDDIEITFYGYFSPDADTVLGLGHLKPGDPILAAELVSPQYAGDFFSGFTMFTNHEFAADLDSTYIDQIDEADEYMVFEGMLDSVEGNEPGYLMFLSTSRQVFVIYGYQDDDEDLFSLAEQTIEEGNAPLRYSDYSRIELSDDGSIDESDVTSSESTQTRRPTPTQAPSNTSARSQDQSAAVSRNPNAYVGETVVVSGDVAVIAQDTDGTTYIVVTNQVGASVTGFMIAYPGNVPGVTEGDRITVTGTVVGVEDLEGDLLPLILASDID